jgi:hypothetical protein
MNNGVFEMKATIDILSRKLSDKDLIPVEVSRLVKDVTNIMGDAGGFTIALINQKLEILGWKGQILDEFSFELILSLVGNEYGDRVAIHTLH